MGGSPSIELTATCCVCFVSDIAYVVLVVLMTSFMQNRTVLTKVLGSISFAEQCSFLADAF